MKKIDLFNFVFEFGYFTVGSREQFEKLKDFISDNPSIREIALLIWICSEDVELSEIEINLKLYLGKEDIKDE